jgi:hypothetical protein
MAQCEVESVTLCLKLKDHSLLAFSAKMALLFNRYPPFIRTKPVHRPYVLVFLVPQAEVESAAFCSANLNHLLHWLHESITYSQSSIFHRFSAFLGTFSTFNPPNSIDFLDYFQFNRVSATDLQRICCRKIFLLHI